MAPSLAGEAESPRREDHALDLRRAAGVVGVGLAVPGFRFPFEGGPAATGLELAQRTDDLVAELRKPRQVLLGDHHAESSAEGGRPADDCITEGFI